MSLRYYFLARDWLVNFLLNRRTVILFLLFLVALWWRFRGTSAASPVSSGINIDYAPTTNLGGVPSDIVSVIDDIFGDEPALDPFAVYRGRDYASGVPDDMVSALLKNGHVVSCSRQPGFTGTGNNCFLKW